MKNIETDKPQKLEPILNTSNPIIQEDKVQIPVKYMHQSTIEFLTYMLYVEKGKSVNLCDIINKKDFLSFMYDIKDFGLIECFSVNKMGTSEQFDGKYDLLEDWENHENLAKVFGNFNFILFKILTTDKQILHINDGVDIYKKVAIYNISLNEKYRTIVEDILNKYLNYFKSSELKPDIYYPYNEHLLRTVELFKNMFQDLSKTIEFNSGYFSDKKLRIFEYVLVLVQENKITIKEVLLKNSVVYISILFCDTPEKITKRELAKSQKQKDKKTDIKYQYLTLKILNNGEVYNKNTKIQFQNKLTSEYILLEILLKTKPTKDNPYSREKAYKDLKYHSDYNPKSKNPNTKKINFKDKYRRKLGSVVTSLDKKINCIKKNKKLTKTIEIRNNTAGLYLEKI